MHDHLNTKKDINGDVLNKVFSNVFRRKHRYPGFSILSFHQEMNSELLRKTMIDLKSGLSIRCQNKFNQELDYFWLSRFDQQKTTKFHRDNAPIDSYLVLGYEPTKIESRILFADYHRFVSENKLSIDEYYKLYNPIFKVGEKRLSPYIIANKKLDKTSFHIVIINNSDLESEKTFGILHKAEMITKDQNQERIVNSMMLCLKSSNEPQKISKQDEIRFVGTKEINK